MTDRGPRSALVITASDGAAAGVREDTSGGVVEGRLAAPLHELRIAARLEPSFWAWLDRALVRSGDVALGSTPEQWSATQPD